MQDTKMRPALPAKLQLQVTLRYLASGDSFMTLESLYRVANQSISNFVPRVLSAITEVLKQHIEVRFILYMSIYLKLLKFYKG